MDVSDDDGGFDGGGGFDGAYDTPLIDPLEAAWVDGDLRNPAAGPTEQLQRYRPRRKDPCPCGSGKKFKNCCINAPWPTRRGRYLKFLSIILAALILAMLLIGWLTS